MSESPQDASDDLSEGIEDEDRAVYLVDPDDYQKTKKLKQIHKARSEVGKVRRNMRRNVDDLYDGYRGDWGEVYALHLAEAVCGYGHEVLPIIKDAANEGAVGEDMLIIEAEGEKVDIEVFIATEGRNAPSAVIKDGVVMPQFSMTVYRRLDHILRELGLGLQFDTDKGPAEI